MQKLIIALVFVSAGLMSFGNQGDLTREEGKPFRVKRTLGNDSGIEFFKGTWKEALKKADKEDKLVFVDAYAAWCGPCKLMAKNTFTDEGVGEFFNANFVNVKMDMEKHAEGPRLSKKYKLTEYPTLYFVDQNEDLVHSGLGYLKPGQLINLGEQALLM